MLLAKVHIRSKWITGGLHFACLTLVPNLEKEREKDASKTDWWPGSNDCT